MIGLSYFELSYGAETDHHVDEVKIRLLPSLQGTTLTVQVTAQMEDGSGHRLDDSDSDVVVACVPTTNGIDEMSNQPGIGGITGDSRQVTFPINRTNTRGLQGSAACLTGFDVSYQDKDHHLRDLSGITTFNPTSLAGGTVYANTTMKDNSGNSAQIATTDVSVVLTAGPDADGAPGSTLMIGLAPDVEFSTEEVSFDRVVGEAVAVISAFAVDYGETDHHVRKIAVGAKDDVEIEGSVVKLKNSTGAEVKDNSGHSEKKSLSSVTMTVLALPAG